MWPYLSSPFSCLPHLVPYWSLWKVHNGSVSPDLCWWLRDPWSALAPHDLLSVVTSPGVTHPILHALWAPVKPGVDHPSS